MILVEYSPDKVEVHDCYVKGDKYRRMLINDGKGWSEWFPITIE